MVERNKKMGGLLLTFLWVLLIFQISLILLNLYWYSSLTQGIQHFLISRAMISSLVEFVAIILIFKWKKFGVYLFILLCLSGIIYGFTTFKLVSIINMVIYLIVLGILYYLIRPIWASME